MMAAAAALPPIEIDFPNIERWQAGNTGIPYVWRFEGPQPGPRVTIQALTHGNEVCGAIVNDWLLAHNVRATRGTLTVTFANIEAYRSFSTVDPYASRCLDEDFNRLWSDDVLQGSRQSRDLARARALRPVYDTTDHLLDLHSMTDPCPPLALAGRQPKGLALARAVGVPRHVIIDAGHAAGRRLRDYAGFDVADDPRSALLIECGQHWERSAPEVARQATLRFLRHFDMLDAGFLAAHIDAGPLPPQQAIEVTDIITIMTDQFRFVRPVEGLQVIAQGGTLLAQDGATEVRTPYDNCVLIMPTRRPRRGETAVRIGRVVG